METTLSELETSTRISVTRLTPRGRGAVASLSVQGDAAIVESPGMFRAANGKRIGDQPLQRIVFGHWGCEIREDVVVCRVEESITEIHCHGGDHATNRIMDDLVSAGCEVLSWHDTQRERREWLDVELDDALSQAPTLRTADYLLTQRSGCLKDCLISLSRRVTELADHTDEKPHAVTSVADVIRELDDLLAWSNFGCHLTKPWKIMLAGRPNVGKSSLINALVGYSRAIVSAVPGTTRDLVTAETAFEGWPVQLIDSAGLRDSVDEVESIGVERSRQQLQRADCRVILLDVSEPITDEERQLIDGLPQRLVVAHKCDLETWNADDLPPGCIHVSSTERTGLDELMSRIIGEVLPTLPSPHEPLPISPAVVEVLKSAKESTEALNLATAAQTLGTLLTARSL